MDNINSIPFIYVVTPPTLGAAGTSASTTLIMQADSRFELAGFMATAGAAVTTEESQVNPNSFSCTIRDQTTGRELMSAPVPQRVLCGNAFNGFLQRRPVIFEPQSNLLFTFTSLTGATNSITLTLHGTKIFL